MHERIIDSLKECLEEADLRSLTAIVVAASVFSTPGALQRGMETGDREQLTATAVSLFCSILAFTLANGDYSPREME